MPGRDEDRHGADPVVYTWSNPENVYSTPVPARRRRASASGPAALPPEQHAQDAPGGAAQAALTRELAAVRDGNGRGEEDEADPGQDHPDRERVEVLPRHAAR